MNYTVKLAEPQQYEDVAAFLRGFTADNMTNEQRKSGFLQGKFTREAVAWFADSLGVVIALDGSEIVGVLCGCDFKTTGLPPQIVGLRDHLHNWRIDGKLLDPDRVLGYGPVCISHHCRGTGMLRRLFEYLLSVAGARYSAGLAFVDSENLSSMNAHVRGLGMQVVGDYEFNGRALVALGFTIPMENAR